MRTSKEATITNVRPDHQNCNIGGTWQTFGANSDQELGIFLERISVCANLLSFRERRVSLTAFEVNLTAERQGFVKNCV